MATKSNTEKSSTGIINQPLIIPGQLFLLCTFVRIAKEKTGIDAASATKQFNTLLSIGKIKTGKLIGLLNDTQSYYYD